MPNMSGEQQPTSLSNLEWVFDPTPPSGSKQGGVPTAFIFRPDVDTFVREVVQNSLDQKNDSRVTMRFIFERLEGDAKEGLLSGLDYQYLRNHLDAASKAGFITISPRLTDAIRSLDNAPLTILRIEDYGTKGLTGGEDASGKNFSALCKNTLDTGEDKPARGGSYGLGKAVLWSFSSISTVLFSSILDDNSIKRFRLFGRSELPYHATNQKQWSGPGWYGKTETLENSQQRAVSAWDNDVHQLSKALHLARQAEAGTGTSILVLGFKEPREDEARPLKKIAADVSQSAAKWFWPSLTGPNPKLEIFVEAHDITGEIFNQKVKITADESPFVLALNCTQFVDSLDQPENVSKASLSFTVPARKPNTGSPGEPEKQVEATLKVRQAVSEESPFLRNNIALIRGAGMVVEYRNVPVPMTDKHFHGVLLVGLANDDSELNRSAERFFRAAEPPSHRDWDATTDRVHAEYKQGGQARIKKLFQDMESAIVSMCQVTIPDTSEGPEKLRNLFRIGGRGGGGGGENSFHVTGINALFEKGIWHFFGRVIRHSKDNKPWEFTVRTWLAGETGKGEIIPIGDLTVDQGDVSLSSAEGIVVLPRNAIRVNFEGETRIPDENLLPIIRNTRLRVEVQPRFRSTR